MSAEIIEFTGQTRLPIDPNRVVRWADDLKEAVVVGIDEGGELYVAGSNPDVARVVYLLNLANKFMLEIDDG